MKQKIGQQLIIGLEGKSLEAAEADFIIKHNIGGVVLFARNLESPQQLRQLTSSVQALRHKMPDKAPLFVSIDMEGGRVNRLPAPFTQWPPASKIGKIDSTSVAFKFASAMGAELKAIGINVNFAPSVDVLSNASNTAIGDRSFSSNPELVSKMASAVIRGFIKSDLIPVAKHFPGHGNTVLDSHDELPIENKTLSELEALELIPFKKAFRARLDIVMTSHLKFPNIDPEWPVTLSSKFLTEILKNQLRYRNLIVTDDLGMGALTKHYDTATIAVRAIQAGAHILLFCNEPAAPPLAYEALVKALENKHIEASTVVEATQKILALKKDKIPNPDPLSMDDISRLVGHPDHLRLAKAISAGEVPEDLLAGN